MGSDDSDEVDKHERVLAPDDLDITKRPEVEEIDDGRYVVSPNGPAKKPDRELLENPDWLDDPEEDDTSQPAERSQSSQRDAPSQSEQSMPTQPPVDDPQQPRQGTHPTQQPSDQGTQPTPQNQPAQQPPNQSTTQSTQSEPQQPPNRGHAAENPPSSDTPQSKPSGSPQSTNQNQPQSASSQPGQAQSKPSQAEPNRPDQPTNRELAAHNQPPAEPPAAKITNENVSKFLAQSLAQASGDYGFDATVNVEGNVNRGRMTSDDIGETLETLLRWYAKQTTDEVDPEHVLGIILAGSDLAVEYPVQSAYAVVKQHGLGPDDTISDLLSAVRQSGSFTVPPSNE